MMPRGQHRRMRRDGETKNQCKRRNIFFCINQVVEVGEQLTSNTIMQRAITKFGARYIDLPKNADALGYFLRGNSLEYTKVRTKGHNEWRRIQ